MTAFAGTHLQNAAAPLQPSAGTSTAAAPVATPAPTSRTTTRRSTTVTGGITTTSLQLLIVVLVAAWSRTRLTRGQWLAFHRLSYAAFAAALLHGVVSGTDLAYPWLAGIAWLVAAIQTLASLKRIAHAVGRDDRLRA